MYKGLLNGIPVAVKKLNPVSGDVLLVFCGIFTVCRVYKSHDKISSHLDGRHANGPSGSSVLSRDPDSESVSLAHLSSQKDLTAG